MNSCRVSPALALGKGTTGVAWRAAANGWRGLRGLVSCADAARPWSVTATARSPAYLKILDIVILLPTISYYATGGERLSDGILSAIPEEDSNASHRVHPERETTERGRPDTDAASVGFARHA